MSLIPGATGTPSSFPDGFQVAGNGSPATPAFTFLSPSNNTGMYSPGDDQIAFSSNGVRSLLVGSSGEFIIGPSSGAGLTHTIQSGGGTTLLNLTSSAGAFSTQIKFNAAGSGNGGILIPASGSFTFRNNTDTTTFGEVSLGGAWSFGVVPGSGSSALSHTFQADGSVSVFLNTSTHSDASPLLRFRRGGSDRASIGIAGAGAGSIGSISSPNDFIIYTNGYPFKISTDTAANTALSITTSGAVTLGPSASTATNCVVNGAASVTHGVVFPASQNAVANANTLDDYEEGTFTPTLTASVTNPTNYGQNGRYTKIGNLVHAEIYITFDGTSTFGSGIYIISGLPFATAATHIVTGWGTLFKSGSGWYEATMEITAGGSGSNLIYTQTNSFVTHANPTTWNSGSYFKYQFTYRVA